MTDLEIKEDDAVFREMIEVLLHIRPEELSIQ
jgi:hypothetical protein